MEARAAAAWAAAQGGEGASLAAVAPHPPGPIVYTSIDYDMLVGQRRRRRAPGEKGGTTPRRKRGAAADKAKANLRSREQLEKKKKQGRGRAARLKMRQTRLESDGGAPLQTGAKGRRGRPPKAAGGLPPPPLPLPDAAHVIWDMARRPADYADNGLLRGAYNCAQLRDMAVLLRRLAAGQPPIAAPGSAAAATPAKTGQTLL